MRLGIDISVLQTPHRMRGIGYSLINFINHIPKNYRKKNKFIFFMYAASKNEESPLQLLHLEGMDYEIRLIERVKKLTVKAPGRLQMVINFLNNLMILRDIHLGDSRLKNIDDMDYFIQFDQNQPLPSKRKVLSALIIHDLIPYIMEADYLWSYKTARLKGVSRKASIRYQLRRNRYKSRIRLICKKADKLISNSEHTKKDFVKHLGIKPAKITPCLLGVEKAENKYGHTPKFKQYKLTSWGYLPEKVELNDKPFVLFVGGADPRRKLIELVSAFNNLRARSIDIRLVLAGDTMMGAFNIPNLELQEYFKNTSYMDNIIFLGFVTDNQRNWLYRQTHAFIYPSVYEGFGLPILEAMNYGAPVICYRNTSIPEVAGDAAIYVENHQGIYDDVLKLTCDPKYKAEFSAKSIKQASKFSWEKTATKILDQISK